METKRCPFFSNFCYCGSDNINWSPSFFKLYFLSKIYL